MIVLGIDPGAKGALVTCKKMSVDPEIYSMGKNYTDIHDKILEIRNTCQPDRIVAYCEQVGGYAGGAGAPGSAMFNFGMGYGAILTSLYALGIPVTLVTPKKWQKHYQMNKETDEKKADWKRRLAFKARQLYPTIKFNQDVADAVLIWHYACYCERTQQNT